MSVSAELSNDGGFATVHTEVKYAIECARETYPGSAHFNLNEEAAISRTASKSILRVLSEQGVGEAAALIDEIEREASRDPLNDLFAVAQRYESNGEFNGDENAKAMARLAWAVEGTGLAAVVALRDDDYSAFTLSYPERVREKVKDYDEQSNLAGTIAGDILYTLLGEIRAFHSIRHMRHLRATGEI